MVRFEQPAPGRRSPWLPILVAAVAVLAGITFLAAPRTTAPSGEAAQTLVPGVIATGPVPSTSLARPGSQSFGPAGTDSRDNGTANAGRQAPGGAPGAAASPTPDTSGQGPG